MKKIVTYFMSMLLFAVTVAGPVMTLANPAPQTAGAACVDRVLLFPTWFRGITKSDTNCNIQSPNEAGGIQAFITKIALNIIEAIMVGIAYIAIFFILLGGFRFIANNGSPATVEQAVKMILNAVIGLTISLSAVSILNFVFGVVGAPERGATDSTIVQDLLNTIYFIAGIIAVVVIVIAGLNYSLSGGDSGKITKAKNQILYAVIGLFIVLSAFAITNFVIGAF